MHGNLALPRGTEKAPPSSGELPCPLQHGVDHRLGELAGERVLLAGVVATDERPAADLRSAPWPKRGRGRGCASPRSRENSERGIPGERAETDDHFHLREKIKLA